jgi:anti-sigma factor RsiW
MKHPSQENLALFAGGDLGAFDRWRTSRHVSGCERCQTDVARFKAVRSSAAELDELPGVAWSRLAAEMSANIRLGLAAGALVVPKQIRTSPVAFHPRALVASGCVAALLMAGAWLQHPAPQPGKVRNTGVVLANTENGIAVGDGEHMMTLINGRGSDVLYSAGAQGMMRARYVDSDTGQVTINNVYVE